MASEVKRAKEICLAAKGQVMTMFQDARLGKAIDPETTLPLVDEISASVQRNAVAILSVARLKSHDDYTYMHSVAVCALMLALAKQLDLDEEQTRLAGVGGLMHDLGKAFMPLEILNKPGKLTDAEFAVMKTHPEAGAQVLRKGGAAVEVEDIALHHHEKINGKGYPHGLTGDDISLLARMGAVCDVYDAVTSLRSYKSPWDPAHTMREMARWEGHFDKRVFNAFVKSVGIYPVGSLVRLASKRLAVGSEFGNRLAKVGAQKFQFAFLKFENFLGYHHDYQEQAINSCCFFSAVFASYCRRRVLCCGEFAREHGFRQQAQHSDYEKHLRRGGQSAGAGHPLLPIRHYR